MTLVFCQNTLSWYNLSIVAWLEKYTCIAMLTNWLPELQICKRVSIIYRMVNQTQWWRSMQQQQWRPTWRSEWWHRSGHQGTRASPSAPPDPQPGSPPPSPGAAPPTGQFPEPGEGRRNRPDRWIIICLPTTNTVPKARRIEETY